MNIKSISGWALDRACEIDASSPGFLGSLFRSSSERRHVIFAYLSARSPATKFADDTSLGAFLAGACHDEILSAAFSSVPRGLRTCLARSGDRPHPRRHYRYLTALLASDRRRSMCDIVRRLGLVTPDALQIIRALPDALRDVRLVSALRSVDDARDVACLYRLLISSGVQEVALKQALSTIRTMADVRRLASSWSQRVTFPVHPVPGAPGYEPITNGAMLKEAAIRLRNCSRNYIPRIMEQRSSFAIIKHNGAEAMVHLIRDGDGWELDCIYAPGNCRPEAALRSWAESYLAKHGLMQRARRTVEREWSCMRRLAGHLDFETD